MGAMDDIAALDRSIAEFRSRLEQVGDDHWGLPTPCDEWDVHALVNHVLLGTRMSVDLLQGANGEDLIAGFGDDLVDRADPIGGYDDLTGRMRNLFAQSGGLDGTVLHPMGEIPRAMCIGFRIGDQTAHAWDLARAIGADEALDPELLDVAWARVQPQGDMIAGSGMFGTGASGAVGDDAPLQDRYLDFIGRRP